MLPQESLTNNTTKVERNNSVQNVDKKICDDVNVTVITNDVNWRHTMVTLNSVRLSTQLLRSLLMVFILLTSLNAKQFGGNFSIIVKFEAWQLGNTHIYMSTYVHFCTHACI